MVPALLLACSANTPPTDTQTDTTTDTGTPTGTTGIAQTGDTGDSTPTEEPCVWSGSSPLRPTAECPVWRMTRHTFVTDLDIEPGTVLEADGETGLFVTGRLHANGTAAAPIVLRASGSGRWNGVHVAAEAYSSARSELHHVEVVHTSEVGWAAIDVSSDDAGCYPQELDPCDAVQLVVGDVTIRDAAGHGLWSTASTTFETPVRFQDVAGQLAFLISVSLADPVVDDQGGNAHPAIGVAWTPGVQHWGQQAVPLELAHGMVLEVHQEAYHGWTRDDVTIDANTVSMPTGAVITLAGARLSATEVHFAPVVPGDRWMGIRDLGDATAHASQGQQDQPVRSELRLTDCRVEGTTSPAIDGGPAALPPLLTGTTVADVGAAPAEDVCVATCAPLDDPRLGNTLDCSIPVSCVP